MLPPSPCQPPFQRSVKTVRQLAEMPDDRRRVLLRNLSDEQYRDILNVLAGMPDLQLSAHCEVSATHHLLCCQTLPPALPLNLY
ncbi:unnamed protein product [Dibothriocephalus latus]|uniref:Uncharacterized protein n=1 Tax=Dibothriocephalus latus TaxID=60516 RepID=A0A3P7P382_DIBLA|nr:unnamed protein product [Dibothriocephalus latus]